MLNFPLAIIVYYSMSNIQKIAKLYQSDLQKTANAQFASQLQRIMSEASALSTQFDIYDEAYDSSKQLAALAYRTWQSAKAPKFNIPASVFQGKLDSMKSMLAKLNGMNLHSAAKAKLSTLSNLINKVVPVDVEHTVEQPQMSSGEGFAQKVKPEEDPQKLSDVVDRMVGKQKEVDYFNP